MKAIAPVTCSTLILFFVACSAGEPSDAGEPQAAQPAATAGPDSASGKDRVRRVRALLQARHTADLPDKQVLDRHPEVDESLRWLAANDETRVIRVRALALLHHYPTDATRQLLLEVAAAASLPAAIRAAALRGMDGFDLSKQTEVREVLALHLGDADLMMATAAAQTLAGQASTIELVRRAAADERLPAATREAAERALESR